MTTAADPQRADTRAPGVESSIDAVARRATSDVAGDVVESTQAEPALATPKGRSSLVGGATRWDVSFLGLVAVALMVLCVVSGPGTPLFLLAIGAGAALAVGWVRFRKTRHPSLTDDRPDE